mmetsp:Transcript_23956/g.56725  ORF Transcript_23956/g.56725 Transcript_23956/m.56725 type:complete len:142 (+) Transcript_23956:167-592(+)
MMSKLAFVAAVAAAAAAFSEAFMLPPAQNANGVVKSTSSTSLNIFGGLKGAFANDDSLGERENAGLKNGPKTNDQVTVNGKSVPGVVVDQRVSVVCSKARAKVSYNCQNGECGTCTIRINGRPARACVSKVPQGKCNIVTP